MGPPRTSTRVAGRCGLIVGHPETGDDRRGTLKMPTDGLPPWVMLPSMVVIQPSGQVDAPRTNPMWSIRPTSDPGSPPQSKNTCAPYCGSSDQAPRSPVALRGGRV